MKQIAQAEGRYQEELNRAFGNLNEGAFKGLRRQLPVTRQKVEWEKIGGYKVSFLLGFGLGCGLASFLGSLWKWEMSRVLGGILMLTCACACVDRSGYCRWTGTVSKVT